MLDKLRNAWLAIWLTTSLLLPIVSFAVCLIFDPSGSVTPLGVTVMNILGACMVLGTAAVWQSTGFAKAAFSTRLLSSLLYLLCVGFLTFAVMIGYACGDHRGCF